LRTGPEVVQARQQFSAMEQEWAERRKVKLSDLQSPNIGVSGWAISRRGKDEI